MAVGRPYVTDMLVMVAGICGQPKQTTTNRQYFTAESGQAARILERVSQ